MAVLIFIIIKVVNRPKDCESGLYLPSDDKTECKPCSLENCDKCSGTKESNICSKCTSTSFPFYENNALTKCNPCDIGEDDKCLVCDEGINKCSKCNIGYKLENGKCILNYSIKAIYYADKKKSVTLINSNYKSKIKEILIDGINQTNINNAYMLEYGNHTVFILLDMNSLPQKMFDGCGGLEEIYFSSQFRNIEIKSLEYMFNGCTYLNSIDFSNFIINNVTSLLSTFNGCSSLKNINISNIDISKVKSMKYMFNGCEELEYIEFPNIKTKELEDIDMEDKSNIILNKSLFFSILSLSS